MNTEERIEELQNEIRRLKGELADIRCSSIKAMVRENFIIGFYVDEDGNPIVRTHRNDYADVWNTIRLLSTKLFMKVDKTGRLYAKAYYEVPARKVKQEELTHEQRRIAARFADEVIRLYNRYLIEANSPFIIDGKSYTIPVDYMEREGNRDD